MDSKDMQVVNMKEVFDWGKHLVEFAQDNPFTIILLGVGVILDRAWKNYQINNKEEN